MKSTMRQRLNEWVRPVRRLLDEAFPASGVEVASNGNVLAAEELRRDDLDYHDPDYELLINIRAAKSQS